MMRQQCTDGPYPTIDFTSLFSAATTTTTTNTAREETEQQEQEQQQQQQIQLKQQVLEACKTYGCFRVVINTTNEEIPTAFSNLAKEAHVKQVIESLFLEDDEFIMPPSSSDGIASFYSNSHNDNENPPRRLFAKFRGRSAESGSILTSKQNNNDNDTIVEGEPKLSWEYFRCSQMLSKPTTPQEEEKQQEQDLKKIKNNTNSRLRVLQDYTNALHSIAELICSPVLLDLPPETFVSHSSSGSMDLLRAFQYDALSSKEEQLNHLGSSPHTDWGSLTVVWQDSRGGLQIFSNEDDCWNDVPVGSGSGSSNECHFFIHVGDFLSLAINGASQSYDGSINKSKNGGEVSFPSPLHRVLCPLKTKGRHDDDTKSRRKIQNDDNNESDTRCSLVYFAYPPPGISLETAQKRYCETKFSKTNGNKPLHHPFPLGRYMLLNDQSVQDQSSSIISASDDEGGYSRDSPDRQAKIVYDNIYTNQFDNVIRDKWKQVQR